MTKKKEITLQDLTTFQEAIRGTKPLLQNKVRLTKNRTSPSKAPIKAEMNQLEFKESTTIEPVRGDEFIHYKHPSISNKILRKLRKGQYNIEAVLDLHGLVVEEAKTAVSQFILQALNANQRVILIIHGKGRHNDSAILKTKINQWLRHLPTVLAFCTANPIHGSSGAMYVLLKRTLQEN